MNKTNCVLGQGPTYNNMGLIKVFGMGCNQSKSSAGRASEKDVKDLVQTDSKEGNQSNKTKTAETGDANAAKGFNINALPEALKNQIGGEWLRFEETVHAERAVSPILDTLNRHKHNTLFKPVLTELEAAYYVLTGRPELLLRTLAKNPDLFFKPCMQINDAAGQIFHNVSPADLIDFLCDDDMQYQVATFAGKLPLDARESFVKQWTEQRSLRGRGGADLVKVARDPLTMPFKGVLEFKQRPQRYTARAVYITPEYTFSLLKNSDGIIYYLDADLKEHWYYANKDKETIESIELPAALLAQHQEEYEQLKADMDSMEPFSARRSSNQEHQLIQILMLHSKTKQAIQLVREGIEYTQDNIKYRDTHYDFNRIYNVYRKCIQLYCRDRWPDDSSIQKIWMKEQPHRIREVMHVVQRLCEPTGTSYPFSDFNPPAFNRSFKIRMFTLYNVNTISELYTDKNNVIFDTKTGAFHHGFGASELDYGFSIYRGGFMNPPYDDRLRGAAYNKEGIMKDLIVIQRWMENAIENVNKFEPTAPRFDSFPLNGVR